MKKILLIGNGDINQVFGLDGYDQIIIFNKLRHKHVISYMTQHWLRFGPLGFHGNELIPKHNASIYTVNQNPDIESASRLSLQYNRKVEICNYDKTSPWYDQKSGTCFPSTGAVAIKHFVDLGFCVKLVGFQFTGCSYHNWKFEQSWINQLKNSGQVE